MVTGQKLEFSQTPCQLFAPKERHDWNETEVHTIDTEIKSLLQKGAIVECDHESGEYISPIFTTPKKDGSSRMILNLKSLNKFIEYHCFMASVDLKDAYYSVPIAQEHQKYLKFLWRGQLYKFVCFPNGLAFCPRKFTKLLRWSYTLNFRYLLFFKKYIKQVVTPIIISSACF